MKKRINRLIIFDNNPQINSGGWTNIRVDNGGLCKFVGNIEPGSTEVDPEIVELIAEHFLWKLR